MTLSELKAQAAALQAQIKAAEEAGKAERGADLATVQALIAKHSFERTDLFPRDPVPVKYRGPNGETWTGRGFKPKWLETLMAQGTPLETFAA